MLFLDADISSLRYQSPKVIGIGILGGIANNYYYKIILTELIYEENIDFKKNVFSLIKFSTGIKPILVFISKLAALNFEIVIIKKSYYF